jgi:hypothetical protein
VNLIKRNLVFDQNLTLSSRFAYSDREFLASTDERFRPVSLSNGPDGALWSWICIAASPSMVSL